jgi:hypothetical protein
MGMKRGVIQALLVTLPRTKTEGQQIAGPLFLFASRPRNHISGVNNLRRRLMNRGV